MDPDDQMMIMLMAAAMADGYNADHAHGPTTTSTIDEWMGPAATALKALAEAGYEVGYRSSCAGCERFSAIRRPEAR